MNTSEVIKRIEKNEQQRISNLQDEDKKEIIIQDIIYIGKIKDIDIYRLAEQDNRDNYSSVIYKYFDGNAKLKGIKNMRPDGELEWIPNDDEEWDKLKDEIDKNEVQLEEEIESILAQLGISIEDTEKITELDLEQKIREKEDEDKELEEQEEQDEKGKESKDKKKNKFEQTSEYKDIEQEIDTDKIIDQRGLTLGKALGLEEYSKILVVHSEKLSDIRDQDGERLERMTKGMALLGVTQREGKQVIEKIPEDKLQYYRGSNDNSVRFDDNDEVEKNTRTTERFVNPTTNKGIAIERREMEVKVYYQGGIDLDDNTAVMGRIEDSRTGWINTETKEIFNSNQGIYHQDKINTEMEQHDKDNGEEINRENADGNVNTVSEHIHEIENPDDKIVYDGEILKADEVAEKMNIPVYLFIKEYNKRAKELDGEDKIDLEADLYNEIEDRAEEKMEKSPKQEKGGFTLGENRKSRGE